VAAQCLLVLGLLVLGPLVLAGAVAAPAGGQAPSFRPLPILAPPDAERHDRELAALRARLLAAIRERRPDAVRAAMAPEVIDQDTPVPADQVMAAFGPLAPGEPLPDEWRALEQALQLGGVVRDSRYVLPYIEIHVAGWQSRREHRFVAGAGVAVRSAPDLSAGVIARLSHTPIAEDPRRADRRGDPASACPSWTAVAIDGRTGWICTIHSRHLSGLYYAFERTDGAWRLARIYSVLR
jgi:hypothetical protein